MKYIYGLFYSVRKREVDNIHVLRHRHVILDQWTLTILLVHTVSTVAMME